MSCGVLGVLPFSLSLIVSSELDKPVQMANTGGRPHWGNSAVLEIVHAVLGNATAALSCERF